MASTPDKIGRYTVIRRLGAGGVGSVYLASDPAVHPLVAIKLLKDDLDNDELRARFAAEAQATGRLDSHENIVAVHDIGDDGGRPYIVMEFVRGMTVGAIIERRMALTVPQKVHLAEQLCDGLGFAHAAGIVHRDIKPANLIVNHRGILKIVDFGIAHLADSHRTQTGAFLGTMSYMAPEQIRGGQVDRRSDIFAVGAVCYELLSGRRAFTAPGYQVLQEILTQVATPLESLCPSLPPELNRIVQRAMEKDPEARYQDLETMRRDLTAVRRDYEARHGATDPWRPPAGDEERTAVDTALSSRPSEPTGVVSGPPAPPSDHRPESVAPGRVAILERQP